MSFLEYLSNTRQEGFYEQAIWSALLPTSENELINFAKETNTTLKTLNKAKSQSDSWSSLILDDKNSGFLGDWGIVIEKFNKVSDYMQISEIISTLEHIEGVKTMEESYLNGLTYILDYNSSNSYY